MVAASPPARHDIKSAAPNGDGRCRQTTPACLHGLLHERCRGMKPFHPLRRTNSLIASSSILLALTLITTHFPHPITSFPSSGGPLQRRDDTYECSYQVIWYKSADCAINDRFTDPSKLPNCQNVNPPPCFLPEACNGYVAKGATYIPKFCGLPGQEMTRPKGMRYDGGGRLTAKCEKDTGIFKLEDGKKQVVPLTPNVSFFPFSTGERGQRARGSGWVRASQACSFSEDRAVVLTIIIQIVRKIMGASAHRDVNSMR